MHKTTRLSELSQYDQIRVIKQAFKNMLMAKGNQFLAKWQGMNMDEVYYYWATRLQDRSVGAIGHASIIAEDDEYASDLKRFKELCATYKPVLVALEDNRQPVSKEQAAANIAKIKAMLSDNKVLEDK